MRKVILSAPTWEEYRYRTVHDRKATLQDETQDRPHVVPTRRQKCQVLHVNV
jgi:hypothetical protein